MKYLTITSPDVNNGEGCRVTLWIPGCSHNCPGCHNKWTHDYNQGREFDKDSYNELVKLLNRSYISGLTISGGDPLDQSDDILKDISNLILDIKKDCPNKTITLYTGYYIKDLKRTYQKRIIELCDVIIEGPYIESLKDISLAFRGSSNQNIIKNSRA